MFIKKFVPRSLFGRFLLIAIIPMIIVQLLATYIFYDRHWGSMSRNMSASLSGEIALVVREFERASHKDYGEIIAATKKYMNLDVILEQDKVLPPVDESLQEYELLAGGLRNYFDFPFVIEIPEGTKYFNVMILMPKGLLTVSAPHKRLASSTTYIFIMWMTGAAVVLLIVAILFLKNQVRSIVRLTKAAEKFGKGHDMPSFKPEGAKEVRLAAIAFIQMRERIKRLLTSRTQMLAGVSHDLRTPLTRMNLQLAMMKQKKEAKEMQADIQEMEKMLDGYLDFARVESKEKTEDIKLASFISKILPGYRNYKGKIEHRINKSVIVHIKPDAFKRCFTNLIDNSFRYGDRVKITADKSDDHHVEIFIDDNGPGIPKSEYENVFQPFYRVEDSRNPETGGVGLGMSIARDIIHKHGGEISLGENEEGGLRVRIELPL